MSDVFISQPTSLAWTGALRFVLKFWSGRPPYAKWFLKNSFVHNLLSIQWFVFWSSFLIRVFFPIFLYKNLEFLFKKWGKNTLICTKTTKRFPFFFLNKPKKIPEINHSLWYNPIGAHLWEVLAIFGKKRDMEKGF
jgi:hypothetical protein